ncbi:MAG: GNAT family N-acetyltransferase [Bacteroidetes bacterium]|nr:GNAT family N-acetyltransferase [Bacteroidota bacterium]MCH8326062.1 GNAT family N-acetyltransferase [Bacteroidota bacterium]
MFKFIPLSKSKLTDKHWDDFIPLSDNGTLFHSRKFLSYHPKKRFKDASLVVLKKGTIFSLFPAAIIKRNGQKILSSHPGSSYGNFVYKSDLNLEDAFSIVEGVIDYAKKLKCDFVELTPTPLIYQSKYSNYLDFALIKNGFEYKKREISSVVQLDIPDGKLLSTFRATARTAIKRSMKLGVEIRECDEFENYYKILKKNLSLRHNVQPTHTLKELMRLKKLFPNDIRLWGAFNGKKLIAGVCNFSANPKVVLAFYISHLEKYQEFRAVNLLFYEIMTKYQKEGFKFLDFGIFTVDMDPNWGLARFKENFGARGIFRDTFRIKL